MTSTAEMEASPLALRPPESSAPRLRVLLLRAALTGAAAAGIVLEHGFYEPPVPGWAAHWVAHWTNLIHVLQVLWLSGYAVDVLVRTRWGEAVPGEAVTWFDWGAFVAVAVGVVLALLGWDDLGWAMVAVTAAALFFSVLWQINVALSRKLARPGVLLPLSFLTLIVVGTVLLKAPVAVPPGQAISWLDAAFTMTSAVCVTGLAVRNTAMQFTPYGQAVIGVFIQLGGLGIIIFGSTLAMLLGQSLSLRENLSLSQMLNDQPLRDTTRFVRFIVLTTLGIELVGAALLYPLWEPTAGEAAMDVGQRVGFSLFHAVSAFCNAGFDLTGQSMIPYRYSVLSQGVLASLIVVGSIGFPVLDNLYRVAKAKVGDWLRPPRPGSARPINLADRRFSLHTKVAVTTAACVYLYGMLGIAAGQTMPYFYEAMDQGVTAEVQRPESLGLAEAGAILADASFMTISARTAGYNSLPMEEMGPAGRFTVMTLMMIGGAPGGTAGGVKTTVVALLVLSVVATLRGREETEAFGRRIADLLVRKAATIGICFLLLVGVTTLLLCLSEPYPFEPLLFEAISAAATTGLTLGVTPDLTAFGKGVIIGAMFLGRVGPLTLMGALMLSRRPRRPYAYAREDVLLG